MDEIETELKHIKRVIASAVIISADRKFLFGRKDPAKGGVYPDAWHLPGGGVEPGESLTQAVIREVREEIPGLDLTNAKITPIGIINTGSAIKSMPDDTQVIADMIFNRYEIRLPETADEISRHLRPSEEFTEVQWFSAAELGDINQIPGGREFFEEAGYIKD